ncbi:MAG: hypothetical protein MI919_25290, partial [Holophagales bacterium]|nr:hypothetical protein [Holophagales bacterium]
MTRKSRTFLAVVALFGIALSASPAFSWPEEIAPPPPAAPGVLFFSGPQPIAQLTVGANLHVALIGGSPNTTYSVSLQDEWGQEISQMPVTTYASGHSGREWLW